MHDLPRFKVQTDLCMGFPQREHFANSNTLLTMLQHERSGQAPTPHTRTASAMEVGPWAISILLGRSDPPKLRLSLNGLLVVFG